MSDWNSWENDPWSDTPQQDDWANTPATPMHSSSIPTDRSIILRLIKSSQGE